MPQWFGKDTDWNDVRRISTGIDVRKRVGVGHDPVTLDDDADNVLNIGIGDTPQEIGLEDQDANTVFAGPTAAPAAKPDFRLLVAADLGSLLPQPVAQGDMLIADATPEWAILSTPGAAGYALVSTATTEAWDQTPTWTGAHTHQADLILDDGVGDSPLLQFVGGSNNDTISIFLNNSVGAGNSDLILRLCATDSDSKFQIADSGGNTVAYFCADGILYLTEDGSGVGELKWSTAGDDGFLARNGADNQPGYFRVSTQGTATTAAFQAYSTDILADAVNTEFAELISDYAGGWVRTRATGTGSLRPLLLTVGTGVNSGIRIEQGGKVFIAEDVNTFLTTGLTIDQAGYDDEIFSLKSSTDVVHPMTALTEADTYGTFTKAEGGSGGVVLTGYKDADGVAGFALGLAGRLGEAADTDKTTSAIGVVTMDTSVTDGGTGIQAVGADGNLFVIRNHTTARFIFDAEGSAHADVEWTTFDAYDDVALLSLLDTTATQWRDPVRASFADFLSEQREKLEVLGIARFDPNRPGHVMLNTTRLAMLLVGAVRQLNAQLS